MEWIRSKELATLQENAKGLGYVKLEDALMALENLEYKICSYYERQNNVKDYLHY
jgi:hypothetical protein